MPRTELVEGRTCEVLTICTYARIVLLRLSRASCAAAVRVLSGGFPRVQYQVPFLLTASHLGRLQPFVKTQPQYGDDNKEIPR